MQRFGLMLLVALAAGCGDDSTTGAGGAGGGSTSSGTACVPGHQTGCTCPGGGEGVQVCLNDGSGLGPCDGCDGAGGAGGEGGARGTSCEAAAAHAVECGLQPWDYYGNVECAGPMICAAECFYGAPCEAFDGGEAFAAYSDCMAACGDVCTVQADCPNVTDCGLPCIRVWVDNTHGLGVCTDEVQPAGGACPGGVCDGMGNCVPN